MLIGLTIIRWNSDGVDEIDEKLKMKNMPSSIAQLSKLSNSLYFNENAGFHVEWWILRESMKSMKYGWNRRWHVIGESMKIEM